MSKFNTWAEETTVRLQESIPVKDFPYHFHRWMQILMGQQCEEKNYSWEDVTDNN